MKAAQINQYGGSDAVVINENASKPTPAAGQILVEVHAAGVNPSDWKIRSGLFQSFMPLELPVTLGGDFSGVVAEIGEGVTGLNAGSEIYGQAKIAKGVGSFAQFSLADVKNVALKPKNLNHVEAAALPLAGVSAWQALVDHMALVAGQKILIHGGAGGIGSLALQIARQLGAYVATTASSDDFDYVKSLGAEEVIDYRSQVFEQLLQNFDAVFDTVGGDTYKRSFQVLRSGGVIVSMLEQPDEDLMAQYNARAISQFSVVTTERLSKIAELVEAGNLKVQIDKVFPLDQAAEALNYLEKKSPRGKVVIKVR